MTAARVWERRAGHADPWWFGVWSRAAQLYLRQCPGARSLYGSGEEGAAEWEKVMLEFAKGCEEHPRLSNVSPSTRECQY